MIAQTYGMERKGDGGSGGGGGSGGSGGGAGLRAAKAAADQLKERGGGL